MALPFPGEVYAKYIVYVLRTKANMSPENSFQRTPDRRAIEVAIARLYTSNMKWKTDGASFNKDRNLRHCAVGTTSNLRHCAVGTTSNLRHCGR